MGEGMAVWFPHGFNGNLVLPGGYAIVGAAALSGSVTHTISTSVIVFELTGQMGHVLPCVVSYVITLTAKLFNWNFHPLEVVSGSRDPQFQVSEKYSDLTKWRSTVFKS